MNVFHWGPSRGLANLGFHTALAAVVGCVVALAAARHAPDTERFLATARNLAEHGRFSLDGVTPSLRDFPMIPWLLAGAQMLGLGDGQLALRLLNGLCLAGTARGCAEGVRLLVPAWRDHAWPPVLALWAAALCPTQLGGVLFVLTEPLFTALLLWGNLLLAQEWRGEQPLCPRRWALAGGLLALASLTRSIALPYAIVAIPLAGAGCWLVRRQRALAGGGARPAPRAQLACVGLALLVLAGTLAPWGWRNYAVAGRWIPICVGEGLGLAVGAAQQSRGEYADVDPRDELLAQGLTLPEADARLQQQAWATIRANPGAWLALLPHKMKCLWLDVPGSKRQIGSPHVVALLKGANLLLLAVALGGAWLYRHQPLTGWLLLPPLLFSALHGVLFGMARFRLPVEPYLLILGSAAAATALLAVKARISR